MQEKPVLEYQDLRELPVSALRQIIRDDQYTNHTAGLGSGFLQTNLAIMPQEYALDFMRFCQRNPKPCPLVGVSETGDPRMPTLGDIDVRTDVPSFSIYRNGSLDDTVNNIKALWRNDLVAFAIGCSFTFERALVQAGIAVRHIDENKTVPMYKTNIDTTPAGNFGGGMVVSMRPIREADLQTVKTMCRQFPLAHGAPVHDGDPAAIGITAINKPDWGDPPTIRSGEVPVFWACGVTPQNAIMRARLPFCIS
ncbi:MAG: putative hydro-lyase, partial [Burkholderiaceae bacterium]